MAGVCPPLENTMNIDEIFTKLCAHMCEGVMYHAEMVRAYEFLGLWGFAQCHTHHCFEEKVGHRHFEHYYACHYFKLIQYPEIERPKIISDTWYKYTAQAVDTNTKRQAVKELMTRWVDWEKETKKLYQSMRKELTEIGELDAAMCLDKYICDVSKELSHAEKKLLKLEAMGYDINEIMHENQKLRKKYKEEKEIWQ